MRDFSLTLPTRGDIKGLVKALGSLQSLSHRLDKLEVIMVLDDDTPNLDECYELCSQFDFDLQAFPVKHSDYFCRDYYNFGASKADATNIMMFNDDAYMLTQNWDDIIRRKIEDHPELNGIYLVDTFDSTHGKEDNSFPCFPLISKKAVDTLGFFFYPQVRMWTADNIIYNLYNYAGAVIRCHDVKIQHDHVVTTGGRFHKLYIEDCEDGIFPINGREDIKKLEAAIMEGYER